MRNILFIVFLLSSSQVLSDTCPFPDIPDEGFIYPPDLNEWEIEEDIYILCKPGYVSKDEISSLICNEDGTWNGTETTCVENGLYKHKIQQGSTFIREWTDGDTSTCSRTEAKKYIIDLDFKKELLNIRVLFGKGKDYDMTFEVWEERVISEKQKGETNILVCSNSFKRHIEYSQSIVFPCSRNASTESIISKRSFVILTHDIDLQICEIEAAYLSRPKIHIRTILLPTLLPFAVAFIAIIIIWFTCKRRPMNLKTLDDNQPLNENGKSIDENKRHEYENLQIDTIQLRDLPRIPTPQIQFTRSPSQQFNGGHELPVEEPEYDYVQFPDALPQSALTIPQSDSDGYLSPNNCI